MGWGPGRVGMGVWGGQGSFGSSQKSLAAWHPCLHIVGPMGPTHGVIFEYAWRGCGSLEL